MTDRGGMSARLDVVVDVWAPTDLPRVVDGIVIPAVSTVGRSHGPIYVPVASVRDVRTVENAVGFYTTASAWVVAWEGRDPTARDKALRALLFELARHYVDRRHR